MAIRNWKRMRDEAKKAEARAAEEPNPWIEAEALSALTETYAVDDDADKAERYGEWADRLRSKGQHSADGDAAAPSYWTTDALFQESRRVEHDELHGRDRPNASRAKELLAVLDLPEDASSSDIGAAYRRLAKQHHPDHFATAAPETQAAHAERMRVIIDAYQALKQLEQT